MAKVFVAFKNFDRIQYYGMEEREAEWRDGMKNDDKDTKGKSHKEMQPKMTLCREASNLAPFFIQNPESRSFNSTWNWCLKLNWKGLVY